MVVHFLVMFLSKNHFVRQQNFFCQRIWLIQYNKLSSFIREHIFAPFCPKMTDDAPLPPPRTRRARARELVEELNDFASAVGALQWLFDDDALTKDKLRITELILHGQNRQASDDIDAVVADYEAQDESQDVCIHRHKTARIAYACTVCMSYCFCPSRHLSLGA